MNPSESSSNSTTDTESDYEVEQIVEEIVTKMKIVENKPNAEETIKPKKKLNCQMLRM